MAESWGDTPAIFMVKYALMLAETSPRPAS
jgi:hypothetical protein